MSEINDLLESRRGKLEELLKQIDHDLEGLPQGRLRITHDTVAKSDGKAAGPREPRTRFYQCLPGERTSGRYLQKSQNDLAEALAQKGYLLRLRREVQRQLRFLQKPLPDLGDAPLRQSFTKLPPFRRVLIRPLVEDDATFVARWQAEEYERLRFDMDTAVIITDRGERVRSKSEKILADKLYKLGIPYHYEKPVRLRTGQVYYPDFTALNRRTRENIFLEHFGLMDEANYVNKNLKKLNDYIRAGIIPGKNLMITYETKERPLDMNVVGRLIKSYLF